MSFVHLHVHSEYSLLDGCIRLPDLARKAGEMGLPALALTDHGAVYAAVPFVKAMRANGIKPILGAELYLADEFGPPPAPAHPYHLPVLAATEEGYIHLLELVTSAQLDHFHGKPLVSLAEIAPRAGGLIALSGCLRGELARLLAAGETPKARAALGRYGEIFGRDRFFIELQRHGLPEEGPVNAALTALAQASGFGLVATNDVHYLTRDEADTHDLLLAVQTLSALKSANRLRLPTPEFYLKSGEEMAVLFADLPEALANTERIAEACSFELVLGRRRIPVFPVPAGLDQASYLRALCRQGLVRLFPEPSAAVSERLDYELSVIDRLGFSGYFLIVWDIVAFARREGIPVGPGRGSSVGSLVAYLLGITGVDPLANGLLFERFLNPERAEPPDIDVDLCHRGRARVLEYIRERYGRDHVAHLAAFNTLRPRAAVRDTGRALGVAYEKIDRLAKAIPFHAADLEAALSEAPGLREMVERDEELGDLVRRAQALEGLPRHLTQHAAGVVLAAEPLTHYLALEEAGDGQIVTQAEMGAVEDLGLLKIDLLGLRYLTIIQDTLEFLGEQGLALSPESLPAEDPATLKAMEQGRTTGTFQLESSGMRRLLRRYQPRSLEDISLVIALYRPGPLGSGMVESLIRRRHGAEPVAYLHPLLAEILASTHGVIVYQEQVMETARKLAGYTLGQADLLRKAISKRRPEILDQVRDGFLAGAASQGVDPATAAAIFGLIAEFGGYGFAKAHSAAYALTSYRTVYLKTHYPVAYHAALLTLNLGDESRFPAYLSETRRLGIQLLLPEVNRSAAGFRPEGACIRAGLLLVKDLGARGVAAILSERTARGPFISLGDFCLRLRGKGVTARAVANLIRGGAFDSHGPRAAQLLELHTVWTKGGARARAGRPGQLPLFTAAEFGSSFAAHDKMPEYGTEILQEMEREVLGHYLTRHPLERFHPLLKGLRLTRIEELEESEPAQILLAGILGGLRSHRTRQGKRMLFGQLEDLTGQVELVFFPAALERFGHLLQPGEALLVWGRTDRTEDKASVVVDRVRSLAEMMEAKMERKQGSKA